MPNSFHANGDQIKTGFSKFTYRPFTLEGNFAFAAGLQEMLLQSYAGFIEVMPAVPDDWKDISFDKLRAEGAYLVNSKKENGLITEVKIVAEKDGVVLLKSPFKKWKASLVKNVAAESQDEEFIKLECKTGGAIVLVKDGIN